MQSIRSLIPRPLARSIRRLQRRSRHSRAQIAGVSVTADEIRDELVRLGVEPGDTMFAHSSLTAFGHVEGGPEAVIAAARAAVGPEGTVLMPTYVPTGDWVKYVESDPVYDPATTPSTVGIVTEVFRQQPGVLRSKHPTHAVAGVGPAAGELLASHHESPTPCGPGSPLWKIAHEGGRIVHLGSSFSSSTIAHVVEDDMPDYPIDPYLPGFFPMRVLEEDGSIITVKVRIHNPALVLQRADHDTSISDVYYVEALERAIVQTGGVGNAAIHVIDGPGHLKLHRDKAELGATIYGPIPQP